MPGRTQIPRVVVAATTLLLSTAAGSFADTLLRAKTRVDATDPKSVVITHDVGWNAQGGSPRSEVAFYLAADLEVTEVRSEGAVLVARAEAVPGTTLKKWRVRLPVPLSAGSTRPLVVSARVVRPGGRGLRADASGGCLLPGSGWFPSLAPNSDEIVAHATEFALPAGQRGIACGGPSGSSWLAAQPGRPYAVWGTYQFTAHTAGGVEFNVWRKSAESKAPVRLEKLARLVEAFDTGLGPASGSAAWKLVDVGGDEIAGGQRTLFWNEARAAADPERITLFDRDLSCGLAASFWEEAFRFGGDYAVFAARGISRELGDATAATLDASDDRWKTEALFLKDRRATFVASRSVDRALRNLPLHSQATPAVVNGRAALVAHLAAEGCPGLTYWVKALGDFRKENLAQTATWEQLVAFVGRKYPNQHAFIAPFLDGTDVPDFVLGEHGPSKEGSTGQRYKVEVVNRGKVAGPVDVATFTKDGHLVRIVRTLLEPGQSRSILFGDARRIGQIRLDPRSMTPQYAFENEEARVEQGVNADTTPFVPAFVFGLRSPVSRRVDAFALELEGLKISEFKGSVFLYETHHGPSGAVLVGEGTVDIAPSGAFAAPFRAAMGKEHLTFRGRDLFVRFPLDAWPKIEAQLGDPVPPGEQPDLGARRQTAYEHSFPNGFHQDSRAQVPPPGSALVVFTLEGSEGEWRGYIREPLPDGRVRVRIWDHLHRTTIWESTL